MRMRMIKSRQSPPLFHSTDNYPTGSIHDYPYLIVLTNLPDGSVLRECVLVIATGDLPADARIFAPLTV